MHEYKSCKHYIVQQNGSQAILGIAPAAEPGTLAYRGSGGTLKGANPEANDDLATKYYVDTASANTPASSVIDTLPDDPVENFAYWLTTEQNVPNVQADLEIGPSDTTASGYLKNIPGAVDLTTGTTPGVDQNAFALAGPQNIIACYTWNTLQSMVNPSTNIDTIQVNEGGSNTLLLLTDGTSMPFRASAVYSYSNEPTADIEINGVTRPPLFVGWQTIEGVPASTPDVLYEYYVNSPEEATFLSAVLSSDPPTIPLHSGLIAWRDGQWVQLMAVGA